VPHTFALFANVWEISKMYEINLSHPTKKTLGGAPGVAPTRPKEGWVRHPAVTFSYGFFAACRTLLLQYCGAEWGYSEQHQECSLMMQMSQFVKTPVARI